MIAAPPFDVGATQVSDRLVPAPEAAKLVGAPGTVYGLVAPTELGEPAPAGLTAETRKSYC